ncbi:MAG TPA: TetR/AcrR family transcriptional regulator [Gammaproteobacteria bacterium]|nr:TetR/AcrR family transcriptional regulator [Gammaproteobacteria bacterium]
MPSLKIKSSRNIPEKILKTAIHLFTNRGYFSTSVSDIVRESGVSTGSIYHHFGDKEGIARALFEMLVLRMENAFDDIERQHDTAQARCRAVIKLLFQITEEEPEVMTYMLFVKHEEFMLGTAPICSSKPFRQMREMVAEGMDSGEVRPMDPMVAAASIFGGALRMISMRLDGILQQPLTEYLDELWSSAWRSVCQ